MSEPAIINRPGLCTAHGGLMWSTRRVCVTPLDVIRGGCIWSPLPVEWLRDDGRSADA